MGEYKRNEENKKNDNSGIYCIINKVNGKRYVGQTYDVNYRWRRHKNDLKCNCHSNQHLQNAWNKYGEDNFDFTVLEMCPLKDLDEKEIYWINFYDCFNNGYNLAEGGLGCRGYKHTEEELQKMREAQTKTPPVLQYTLEGEFVKEWFSASTASKALGYNNATNIRLCCRKENGTKQSHGYIWVYKGDEHDMSYYFSGYEKDTKKVFQFNLKGELIREWKGVPEIIKEYPEYNPHSIQSMCNGNKAKTRYGYIWLYEDCLNNLERCMSKSKTEKLKCKIIKKDKDGNIVKIYNNIDDVIEEGYKRPAVVSASNGYQKHGHLYKGYYWYREENN